MGPSDYLTIGLSVLGTLLTLGGIVWKHGTWLTTQFAQLRESFEDKIDRLEENLSDKLQYHERHDDERFSQIHQDILTIKLRNAAIDGPLRAKYHFDAQDQKAD